MNVKKKQPCYIVLLIKGLLPHSWDSNLEKTQVERDLSDRQWWTLGLCSLAGS